MDKNLDIKAQLDALAQRVAALEEDYERLYTSSRRKRAELENGIHDLGNLLGLIAPYLHLLRESEYGPVNEEQQKILTYLIDKADELDQMTKDLLTSAHPINPKSVSLVQVAQEAIQSAAAAAEHADVHLVADLPDDLPWVQADAGQLHRVFDNLLSNAIDFSPPGGEIAVRIRTTGDDQRIDIQDQGPGIAPEHQERIWRRFYRVDPNGTRSGSGLGLAIVKEIVEAHGGEVMLKSTPGQGSTFSFTIPADNDAL